MPLSTYDQRCVEDLLIAEVQNIPTLVQLAKSVTRNVCEVSSAQEALDIVSTHLEDTVTLLQKRIITKEIIFKYLHRRKVPITADFTKATLVQKVLDYWQQQSVAYAAVMANENADVNVVKSPAHSQSTLPEATLEPSQYPINLLARKFAEWFFTNYNEGTLKLEDFWSDATLELRLLANGSASSSAGAGANGVISSLMQSKQQYGFYFNLNLTHEGVQGRMSPHGLVLALACGTLHTQQRFVGVFECTFGLLRDPFAENNWKVKFIECLLRSEATTRVPNLYDSETLRATLAAPMPTEEFT